MLEDILELNEFLVFAARFHSNFIPNGFDELKMRKSRLLKCLTALNLLYFEAFSKLLNNRPDLRQ